MLMSYLNLRVIPHSDEKSNYTERWLYQNFIKKQAKKIKLARHTKVLGLKLITAVKS